MKKYIALVLALVLAFAVVGCETSEKTTSPTPDVKSEGVMTYAEYDAAEEGSQVVIETYVQGKQSWWDNKATVYTQDKDGAYFCYEMACTEEDYAKLVPGTKIKVTGEKGSWAGEIEVMNATFEILEGSYVAEPTDVTSLVGSDDLIKSQNQKVSFKGMTVEAYNGQEGKGFAYKNDQRGDDIYFQASVNGTTVEFCVEYYLTNEETDVYKTVETLEVGQTIDVEGFLYWYEGANPHVTGITVK